MKFLYIAIGSIIAAVAIGFSFVRVPTLTDPHVSHDSGSPLTASPKKLFQHRHFVWAAITQFFNVAAQGGTWAYFINYGVEKIPGLTSEKAAYYFGFSMLMMMIGRFLSTILMRYVIAPNVLLALYASANILLCLVIAQSWGWTSFIALIMLNFFMSIMFPTIFSLGLKDLGKRQTASSYIVMGVAGGAVFGPIMGLIANHDVAHSYYLPIICYAVVFLFGITLYKVRK